MPQDKPLIIKAHSGGVPLGEPGYANMLPSVRCTSLVFFSSVGGKYLDGLGVHSGSGGLPHGGSGQSAGAGQTVPGCCSVRNQRLVSHIYMSIVSCPSHACIVFNRYFGGSDHLELWEAWNSEAVESHEGGHTPGDW